jgi:hypothetical protein
MVARSGVEREPFIWLHGASKRPPLVIGRVIVLSLDQVSGTNDKRGVFGCGFTPDLLPNTRLSLARTIAEKGESKCRRLRLKAAEKQRERTEKGRQ